MKENNSACARPEDQRYPIVKTFTWGLQHVLTMYGGIIAPPLIIGSAAGLGATDIGLLVTAALFISGLSTLLQSLGVPFFGSQLPLVQGVSFAGVATMVAIVTGGGGLPVVFGAVIASSILGLLITPFFAQIIRFFPPVVTGCVIAVIGLSLMPVAALTLGVILLLNRIGWSSITRIAVLAAMIVGTLVAVVTGKADFSGVLNGSWVAMPTMFAFGTPVFDSAAILSMFLIVLVLLTETTAGLMAVGEIVGTDVNGRRIANGLRADMLTSAIAPVFNSFPQSAFAQNIGLVAITGIKSRFVVSAGGAILVVLGLLPVLGRVIACIPMPVLGGAGVVLFGSVAASGIRTLAKVDYKENMNLVVVATALAFGMIPIVMPTFYDQFPGWVRTLLHSGISATCLVAFILNILFNTRLLPSRRRLPEAS